LATLAEPDSGTLNTDETRIEFSDNRLLIDLCGELDSNLTRVEAALDVQLVRVGNQIGIGGDPDARSKAAEVLQYLYQRLERGKIVAAAEIDAAITFGKATADTNQMEMFSGNKIEIRTRKKTVEPRTAAQQSYARSFGENELVFGIGPAGTGKTYIAVAMAVSQLIDGKVDRIILSRPAVEAGERLGFLPGDMKDKVDPYMQPLYDALNDFLPAKQLARLLEEKQIEIAPLAFMRGRTLSNAFVILDEAQNATTMQMKMFLTRLGEGSRMAITGDTTQIDLPRGTKSGLREVEDILQGVSGIAFKYFTAKDVVRHKLVGKIIEAYGRASNSND
jgi:phosphate starvation-inducible PhoH-like protein